MALASAPSTPERVLPSSFIRRSFTAPIKTSRSHLVTSEGKADGAETLYAHNAGKIVSFSTSNDAGRRHSSVSNGRADFEDSGGDLPWASATERTIAAGKAVAPLASPSYTILTTIIGPLRIYRVLGSVAFLSSGNILHPILAKSQCWCVDGESKIVLRIRPNSYYRIELPFTSNGDKLKVTELKSVLSTILQFELTPCPFKREFTVDLPEPPLVPVHRRPWKPKTRYEATSEGSAQGLDRYKHSKRVTGSSGVSAEQEATLDSGYHPVEKERRGISPAPSSHASTSGTTENDDDSEATDDTWSSDHPIPQDPHGEAIDLKTPTRPKALRTGRTVTAPPQLTLGKLPPPNATMNTLVLPESDRRSPSRSSSVESFHSFHSPISPLSPSPEIYIEDPHSTAYSMTIDVPRIRSHKRDASEVTVTADSSELWDMTSADSSVETMYHSFPEGPDTPPLMSDVTSQGEDQSSEALTPSPTTEIRRRVIKSRQRAQSPLPSPANLCSPYSPRSHIPGHYLTTAILQKTCSLLLGPPAQLVALMLRIAAKLTRGTFRGSSFGFGEGGQKIPCSWDFSDGGEESDEIEEDDFGVPLTNISFSRDSPAKELGGSWEID